MFTGKDDSSKAPHDSQEITTSADYSQKLSWRGKFWTLNKFFFPLFVAFIARGISSQALSRGITSIAKEELTDQLASFGLAFSWVPILVYISAITVMIPEALKNVGMVLVYNRQDNFRMTALTIGIGSFVAIFQLVISISPAGVWLFRDVHKQNDAVVKISCQALLYLSAMPLIEAVTSYHEGYLISQKLTLYTGLAKFVECGVQVVTTVVLIFTAPHTHVQPIVIPVLSWYGGVISRMVIVMTVWILSGRKKLADEISKERAAVAIKNALIFWFPLTFSRLSEKASRVIVNLIVSRTLSENISAEAAAKAIAVMAPLFPLSKLFNTWVFECNKVIAVFGKRPDKPVSQFSLKELALYCAFINLCSLLLTAMLLLTPGAAYFFLNTVLGLDDELSTLALVPMRILLFGKCCSSGMQAFGYGLLILKRKTILMAPSDVLRLIGIVVALYSLPLTSSQSGAVAGMTSFVIGFVFGGTFVFGAALLVILKSRGALCCKLWPCRSQEREEEESQKLIE